MNKTQEADCESKTVRLTQTTADALYDRAGGAEQQVNGKKRTNKFPAGDVPMSSLTRI